MTPTRDMDRIASDHASPATPPPTPRGDAGRAPMNQHRRSLWLRRAVLLALLVLVALVLLPRATTWFLARPSVVHEPSDLTRLESDDRRAAIVLGAGLVDRRPSPLLSERIDAAVDLLQAERVDLLLMSGDNTTQWYDEPSAMRRSAIEGGVPVELVAVDYAGRRTWDTCVRAKEIFGIDRAVVVTNAFHVDRAVVTCRAAGIDVTGYSVDDSGHGRSARASWRARELAATGRALLDAWLVRPEPAVGGEKIDPYDPCQLYASLAPSVAEDVRDEFRRLGCR